MNKQLIKDLISFQKEAITLERKENTLREVAVKTITQMGWDLGGRYSFPSIDYLLKLLESCPEDDWKSTLRIRFDPVEIRKIDNIFYSNKDVKAHGLMLACGQTATIYALIEEKANPKNNLTLQDLSFNGAYVAFSPKSDKISICFTNWMKPYQIKLPGKRKTMMDILDKEAASLNKKLLKNPITLLTSPDPYERHLAESHYKLEKNVESP